MLKEKVTSLSRKYLPAFIEIRHYLHAHPELSYQEFKTSDFIREQLAKLQIPFEIKANTGVVGTIFGRNPESRVIALRADMDALPIFEKNNVLYRSQTEGVMHACGHDVHMTCLLGAARILNELKDDWNGTIRLIFQPGEEKNPGGASLMIRDGVLDDPVPEAIVALHVHPQLETGKLSFRSGQVMASADEIYITIKAKGGHAASPHLTADPILIASHLVVALQQVISRNRNPLQPSVLSITSFQGGYATNVIPSEVKLMGTFRALDEEWRFKAHDLIREQTNALVRGMGATGDIHIDVGYPSVYNHEALTATARELAADLLGEENIETTEMRLGAEDFGYYTQQVPGCFYRLGAGNAARGITSGVHTPTFDIDENAIGIGMASMAWFGMMLNIT